MAPKSAPSTAALPAADSSKDAPAGAITEKFLTEARGYFILTLAFLAHSGIKGL